MNMGGPTEGEGEEGSGEYGRADRGGGGGRVW